MTESPLPTCFLSSALLNRLLSLLAKTVPRFPGRSETISSSGRPAAMGDPTMPVSSVKIVPTAPSAIPVFPRKENAALSVTNAMLIVRIFSKSPAAGSQSLLMSATVARTGAPAPWKNIFIPLTMRIRSIGNCFLNPEPASLIPKRISVGWIPLSPRSSFAASLSTISVPTTGTPLWSVRAPFTVLLTTTYLRPGISTSPGKSAIVGAKKTKEFKVDKACRSGRTYEAYLDHCSRHPDMPVTQMDSVEGKKGGKVLLPLHFVKAELMLAFLRDANDSQSVIDIFDRLYLELRPDRFSSLMPLILTDNGSEFSNPKAIEYDRQGNLRTRVFYCDASSPGQKGSAEKNHEFIRYVLPKGTSFDHLTQGEISLLMDHINSYSRESLGNKCPYELFEFLYGADLLRALGCHRIPPNEVDLTPALLNR